MQESSFEPIKEAPHVVKDLLHLLSKIHQHPNYLCFGNKISLHIAIKELFLVENVVWVSNIVLDLPDNIERLVHLVDGVLGIHLLLYLSHTNFFSKKSILACRSVIICCCGSLSSVGTM